jgi:hypothetical protein
MATTLQQTKTTIQTLSGLDIVAGVWLIIAPFVLGYSVVPAALWNDLLVGLAIIVLSATRTAGEGYRMAWPSWTNVALGVWLILAPFILGYSTITAALWNDIILGVIVGGLALWSALTTPEQTERGNTRTTRTP